ncbi:MAG: hypothetical protein HRU72_06030 [Planctomycetia bacterium]|nr:hypothetical protein [Candidatus Brocadia sp.]QOJ06138.1 MAG: hypothetical protein HRU72_06030 [Planctomycetia bacterium]HQU30511.1 hypothetical protein [Candidatus Brocadia sapporoensis]
MSNKNHDDYSGVVSGAKITMNDNHNGRRTPTKPKQNNIITQHIRNQIFLSFD